MPKPRGTSIGVAQIQTVRMSDCRCLCLPVLLLLAALVCAQATAALDVSSSSIRASAQSRAEAAAVRTPNRSLQMASAAQEQLPVDPSQACAHCDRVVLPKQEGMAAPLTLVTGFFNFGDASHSTSEFESWAHNFLVSINTPLVGFVGTDDVSSKMVAMRPAHLPALWLRYASVWDLPPVEGQQAMYEAQHALDPEGDIHKDSEVYGVWSAKTWMVAAVAAHNPFASRLFMWVDVGGFRKPDHPFRAWPDAGRISRMLGGASAAADRAEHANDINALAAAAAATAGQTAAGSRSDVRGDDSDEDAAAGSTASTKQQQKQQQDDGGDAHRHQRRNTLAALAGSSRKLLATAGGSDASTGKSSSSSDGEGSSSGHAGDDDVLAAIARAVTPERVLVGHVGSSAYSRSISTWADSTGKVGRGASDTFLQAGFFAGSAEAVLWFNDEFWHLHTELRMMGDFVGKEQPLYDTLLFQHPWRFAVLPSNRVSGACGKDRYRAFQYALAADHETLPTCTERQVGIDGVRTSTRAWVDDGSWHCSWKSRKRIVFVLGCVGWGIASLLAITLWWQNCRTPCGSSNGSNGNGSSSNGSGKGGRVGGGMIVVHDATDASGQLEGLLSSSGSASSSVSSASLRAGSVSSKDPGISRFQSWCAAVFGPSKVGGGGGEDVTGKSLALTGALLMGPEGQVGRVTGAV